MHEMSKKNTYTTIIEGIRNSAGPGKKFKTTAEMARACGISVVHMGRLMSLDEDKNTYIQTLGRVLDVIGAKVSFPRQQALVVCDVSTPVEQDQVREELEDQDSFSIPQVSMSAAAKLVDENAVPKMSDVQSWLLISESMESLRMRSSTRRPDTLLAVEIERPFDHMRPTIHPGDIAVIDRSDKYERFSPPGNIFLTRQPLRERDETGRDGVIQRVMTEPEGKDLRMVYYCDNMKKYVPRTWSLNEDFGGFISNAIVGRIIWTWSNMSKK